MGSSLYLSGGVQNTSKLVKTFATANSFAVGDVVRYDVASTSFVKAQADSATNSEVVGVVSEASANSFSVVYSGEIDLTSVSTLSGFSGPVLFLTSSVAGGLTANPPSAIGSVVKPLVVRNAATNQYVVTNFLGTQIGGSSTVAIDEIQPVGTIMPFAGSAIPDSWLECNGNSYAVGTYPNLYAKLQNSSGDRVPAYGYVVEIGVNTTTYATWFSSVAVGDTILYDPTASLISTGTATTYALIGRVLAKGTASVTVQIFAKYVQDTGVKNSRFEYPNVIPSTVGWVAAFLPVTNSTIYDNLNNTQRRSNGPQPVAAVSTVAVTHFNTPDLRGRFAIGTNTTNRDELESDGNNYSAIAGLYPLGSQGGQEVTPAGTGVAQGTYAYVTPGTNGLVANMPPYTVVRYIIKATPYTRAALIDGLDLPYSNLLVGDLRDGALRPGGSGEDLVFKTNNGVGGTERMRLSNAGRLGIGTTTPLAIVDVTTSSNTWAFTYGTSSAHSYIGTDTSNNSVLNAWSGHVLQCGGTEKLCLSAAGDLGIGTASPGYTLDLTTNGTARLGSVVIAAASTTINSTNTIIGGNLGINTTNPSAKLQISSAAAARSYSTSVLNISSIHLDGSLANTTNSALTFSSGGGGGAALNFRRDGAYGTFIDFYTNSASTVNAATNRMTIDRDGKVGIGDPAPTYTLDVSGGGTDMLRLKSTQTNSLIRFQDTGTAVTPQIGSAGNDLLLRTNGTDRVRITQAGVGVSTVWIPTVFNFNWSRKAGTSNSTTQGYEPISNPVTMPGNATETYTIIVIFPSYNYDPGDGVFARTYTGIPGGAVLKFANDEAALQFVNEIPQAGLFNGTGGWRGTGHIQAYRTA